MLPTQRGPKPTGWASIEVNGHLLVGEKIGGKWRWECDTLQIAREGPFEETVLKFMERAMGNA